MKKIFGLLSICSIFLLSNAHELSDPIIEDTGLIIEVINKQLKEFQDIFDLSTPLNTGVTCAYLLVNGNQNLWREVSGYMLREYFPKNNAPNKVVNEDYKNQILNGTIELVMIYKNSVACMITKLDSDYYSIRWLSFEDGKWLSNGESVGRSLSDSRNMFYNNLDKNFARYNQIKIIKSVSTDTLAFVNYLAKHGVDPKAFFLRALSDYPLVVYGEYHRRKVSWDFLSDLLLDPQFFKTVGTIFVELPACQQDELDRFFVSKELDIEILLDIMRTEQLYGWWDRGEYEFLVNLWKLNQTLPAKKKIRVVAADEQPPYKFLNTKEDFENFEKNSYERNTRMAGEIEQVVKTKTDKRNCLFIVGYTHAFKSHVPIIEGEEPTLSAGAQLVQRLSPENVFVIFQHAPMGTNRGALGFIRQGLFDAAFEKIGNKPVAFYLSGSPFGTEPFDANYEMSLDSRVGNFEDNFDGYFFLQPIKEEDSDYILYDIWSDKFVDEMKRRATLDNFDLNRWLNLDDVITKEVIIKAFMDKYEGKKRWGHLFE